MIPSPVLSYDSLVSVKENINKKEEKTRKKEYGKNTNQTERASRYV